MRAVRTQARDKLEIGGRLVDVVLKNVKGSRKITLRVTHLGIAVSKPRWVPRREVFGFIATKRAWIEEQIGRQKAAHDLVLQDRIRYLGEERAINRAQRPPVCFVAGEFWSVGESAAERLTEVTGWMRRRAGRMLKVSVLEWSVRMEVSPTKVGVRDQTSRWGSCSSNGSISLNWRLVMTPPYVLEYIVIHELAHLKEHNHSKRFWALVAIHCPDYRLAEKWLDENGEQILLAGRHLCDFSLTQPTLFSSLEP